jgi:hypothetical protein
LNARKEILEWKPSAVRGLWAGFVAIVLVMLAIDLFLVGGGKEHRVSFREAAVWSVIWICCHARLRRWSVVAPRR